MNTNQAIDGLNVKHKVAIDDGSQAFDNFIITRLEMAKDRDKLISADDLFANLRLKLQLRTF
jgi:hypothetical protein